MTNWKGFLLFGILPVLLANAPLPAQTVRARALADLPDEITGYQVHIIYAVPAGGQDSGLDVNGTLDRSVQSFQQWLAARTGGRSLRLDTSAGRADISFLRLAEGSGDVLAAGGFARAAIEAEVVAAGFDDPKKFYAVYYDGEGGAACAESAWPPDTVGSVAVLYLRGPACEAADFTGDPGAPGYRELVMLHQLMHGFGFVARCAPNQGLSGNLTSDPQDLMANEASAPWNPVNLDANHTDYYAHNNPGCLDLAQSVFLDQGSAAADSAPPAWPLPGTAAEDCAQEPALGSQQTGALATLNFLNATGREVEFHWLDQTGARALSRILLPWQAVQEATYEGGQWVVSETDGTCLAIYRAAAGYQRALLRPGRMAIAQGGIGEAFSLQPGLAPGTWVSVYGSGLAAGTASWSPAADQPLPVGLGATSVLVNGLPAPVSFVSPGQVNFLVPSGVAPGAVTVEVRNGPDRATLSMQASGVLPALYGVPLQTQAGAATYWMTALATRPSDASPVLVGNAAVDSRVARAAHAGDLLQLYAIGLGPTDPPVATDKPFTGSAPLRDGARVWFGTGEGQVQFAGLVSTGLYQINVVIPATVGAGDVLVTVEVEGVRSPGNVLLKVE